MAAHQLIELRNYVLARLRACIPPDFAPRRWWRTQRRWRQLSKLAGQRLLREFSKAYPQAFFIQIGANDARQQDPLHFTVRRTAWSGVLVEPVPYVFERLKTNCAELPRLRLENAAISDRDGDQPFYYLASAADPQNLPGWYDGLGSFSKDVILKHADLIPDIDRRLVCAQVPCLTFESLCRKHGIDSVDVVHIDAEGYDDRIVQQLDFVRHRPRLLIYEHFHLGADRKAALHRHLEQHGYEWMEEYLDTWCLDVSARTDARVLRTWRDLRPAGPQ